MVQGDKVIMQNTYLTDAEIGAIQALHKRTPYVIASISSGILSLARRYGGMRYQGERYTYIDASDECVRNDVMKEVAKMRKDQRRARPQGSL